MESYVIVYFLKLNIHMRHVWSCCKVEKSQNVTGYKWCILGCLMLLSSLCSVSCTTLHYIGPYIVFFGNVYMLFWIHCYILDDDSNHSILRMIVILSCESIIPVYHMWLFDFIIIVETYVVACVVIYKSDYLCIDLCKLLQL